MTKELGTTKDKGMEAKEWRKTGNQGLFACPLGASVPRWLIPTAV